MRKEGVNLIPEDIRLGWRLRGYKKALSAVAALYLIALAAVFIWQRSELQGKMSEVERLSSERDGVIARSGEYTELTGKLGEIRRSEEDLRKRLAAASNLDEGRVSWSMVLKRLSNEVPSTVWLKSFSTSDADAGVKKVRFLGTAMTNKGIADFIFKIENSGVFTDVSLAYIQRREFKSASVYDFEVHSVLKRTGG